ncbi:MAG: hypothetical protein IH595_08815 [Bacteroidales bacterium]|nr:hypothetical protein [Bacteroidales bacterium]
MKANEKHRLFFLIVLSGLLLGVSGCSTRRNTLAARLYHRLTSHYNVYWNGKQSLDKGANEIRTDAMDNFSQVLRVYNYGDEALAKRVEPLMQDAIKQSSEGIQQHSMVFNGQELIRWVQYSYLLMGQANFYKKDFTAARRIFEFVSQKYNYAPIHYYGMLWLAKTYIESGDYEKADAELNLLRSRLTDENFPIPLKMELPLVEADFYIARNNLDDAYPFLEQGLKTCRNKELRTRIMFIIGQINQRQGHLNTAAKYFKEVIKRNPVFQLDFEARLRLATSYDTLQQDHKYVEKTLKRMASSNEYQPFLDKIYYALANVAEKSHQDSMMIHYLRLSVSHSKKDNWQKTTSAVKLAKTYFNKGNYPLSQIYYDTAVQSMPKNYPDYDQLKKTASVLSEVVNNTQIIQVQDSLQRMAKMDTATLYALIDRRIKDLKKTQQKEAEVLAEAQNYTPVSNPTTPVAQAGGIWYFDNPAAKSRGYNEFVRQWGNRKLEDMWFLSGKQSMFPSQTAQNESGTTTQPAFTGHGKKEILNASGPLSRAFYLKNIPRTNQEFRISDSLIMSSYKDLGFIYLQTLHDTIHALNTYLALQNRFPADPEKLQNWYMLYQIYSGLNQESKAQVYRDLIVNNYPNSLYAKVIQNPDYYKQLVTEHEEETQLYKRTYNAFENQDYYRTLNYTERAMHLYKDDTVLMPKFLYLRAVSLGKVQVPDSLYNALQLLVKSYPNSDIVPRANEIILMLQKEYGIGITPEQRAALLAKEKNKMTASPYVFDATAPHLVMMLVKTGTVQIRPLIVRLSDFNQKYFPKGHTEIKNITFDSTYRLITVGSFGDMIQTAAYYQALKENAYVFSGISQKDYELYMISLRNYSLFYKDKNIQSYKEFYDEHYK